MYTIIHKLDLSTVFSLLLSSEASAIILVVIILIVIHVYHMRIRKKLCRFREEISTTIEENNAYGLVLGGRSVHHRIPDCEEIVLSAIYESVDDLTEEISGYHIESNESYAVMNRSTGSRNVTSY